MIPRRHNRTRGLTLVEMLVSSVLLGTVLTVLVQGVSLATRISSQAHREAQALQLAETLMVLLRTGQLETNADSDGNFEEEWNIPEERFTWTVTTKQLDDQINIVTVKVEWPEAAGKSSLEVTRYFFQQEEEE